MKTKLAKKHAQAISNLINEIDVANYFIDKHSGDEGSLKQYYLWTHNKYKAQIQLADDYGIELVGLDLARDRCALHLETFLSYNKL